ncbi:hypothetical protein RMCBS344292_15057 [Rhizopus microsporus]|nr:hypothetical protein RMCBS344292_15057 [Rhizopus microsporus]
MSSEPCPLCKTDLTSSQSNIDTWLQCDACSDWYHAHCLKIDNIGLVEKFYCPQCQAKWGPTTYKSIRKSSRSQARLNYADLNEGTAAGDERIWQKLLRAKTFQKNRFERYPADKVNLDLFRKTGFKEPFVIEKNEPAFGMKMPSDLTVQKVADLVGRDRPIEVIDVATQSEITGWTLGRWADYYTHPDRDRIRNVISLEISETALAEKITRPTVVREMDWVDHMWPKKIKERPKVQLYCLMGTRDSYTDFHIDFGGSSVFYHVLSGLKTFYLVEPTPKNLKKYQKWSSSPDQSVTFFGDLVKECYSIELKAGNTMFIPTGWIHAVYTPEDALVIGGNFLHTFNIATQLRVYQIEQATDVPLKFRFPFYKKLNWYALVKFDEWLKEKKTFSYFELESMAVLALFFANNLTEDIGHGKKGALSQSIRNRHEIPDTIEDPLDLTKRVLENSKLALLSIDIPLAKTSPKKKKKNSPKKPKLSKDEVTVADDDEEEDTEETGAVKDEEDDDWNPNEDYDDDYEDVNIVNIPMQMNNPSVKPIKKISQRQTLGNSDEDDMGTSSARKPTKPIEKRKRSDSCSSSQKSTTVKQRLLERMLNKRR